MLAVMAEIFDGRPLPLAHSCSLPMASQTPNGVERPKRSTCGQRQGLQTTRFARPSLKNSKSSIKIQLLIFKKYLTCTQFYAVHLAALCPIEKAGFRLSRRRCAAAESWKAVLPPALPSLPLSEPWCDGPMAVAPLLGREKDSTKRPCEQKEYYGSLIM